MHLWKLQMIQVLVASVPCISCFLMLLFSFFCKSGDTDKGLTVWKFGQASTSTSCHEHRHGFSIPLPSRLLSCLNRPSPPSLLICLILSFFFYIAISFSIFYIAEMPNKTILSRLTFPLHWCCGVLQNPSLL